MLVDSAVVIHAEHRFTGSSRPRPVTQSVDGLIPFFSMWTSFALNAWRVTFFDVGCTQSSPPSSSGNTASSGSNKSSLELVK
jgi:hypothetical protein